MSLKITDDIDVLIDVLPEEIGKNLRHADRLGSLLEVILDVGRPCEARYIDGEAKVIDREVTQEEIDSVVANITDFGGKNRAGIERTLHRISAMRNRQGRIIGLTCRVGRAVYGTVDIIRDIVESGNSILLLGRPGVGKTTMLREVARIRAEEKRVVIVDTSNEIGGDGDIPHPAIGRARRMQVPTPSQQHNIMIQAVENHMPEVIVIDEIGTELEAAAARTIAERGVQLIGTAHGNTLDNLMMNPTLCDLVGGIQSVTLSDEEARRRGTQKSVLERKAPPTFDSLVEIKDWDRVAVQEDVAEAVDAILRGRSLAPEIRVRHPEGEIKSFKGKEEAVKPPLKKEQATEQQAAPMRKKRNSTLRVYPYGLNQNRFREATQRLDLPVLLVSELLDADVVFTLRPYYRKRPKILEKAERRGIPIYVLRNNTVTQMQKYLLEIFGLSEEENSTQEALQEARQAASLIKTGRRGSVQLSPQESYVRRLQHEFARDAELLSRSSGNGSARAVTLYRKR